MTKPVTDLPTVSILERNAVFMEEYVVGTMCVEIYLYKDKMYKVCSQLFGSQSVEEIKQ